MISVLLPTRGRTEAVLQSVASLVDTADNPFGIEILAAVDPDDMSSRMALETGSFRTRVWTAPERYGYARLHEYVNHLAEEADGNWLMLWNDDARMQTDGWDSIVESTDRRDSIAESWPKLVLWPLVNHDQGGNLFPIWPARWFGALGYVSRSPNIDVWISELARRIGVERKIPVSILHDRADITGGHDDQTYREGRALMGPGNDPGYDSQANRMERTRAVKILGRLYDRP